METIKLSDYADIFSGYAFSSKEMQDEGIPIIKISNINEDGTITLASDSNYPFAITKKMDKYWLKSTDYLVCMTGATIGKIGRPFGIREKQCLVNQRVGIIRSKKNVDNDYLFYLLSLKDFRKYIEIVGSGAAQANISAENIGKFTLLCTTDKDTQFKIARVLKNYDKLININVRRINLLESTIAAIYKEWFIRFRFPGHHKSKLINGIPLDWNYKDFSYIYSFDRGVSYSSEEIDCDDGINLVNLKNINSYGGFRRDGLKKYNGAYKEKQKVKYGDLIMGVTDMTQDRRTVGWTALVPDIEGVISMDLVKLNSNLNNRFSQCLFKYGFYSKLFSQFGNGANVIHLKPDSLRNQKILLPKQNLIDDFVNIVNPMFDEIEKIYKQNELLVKQRDFLLPRLMSGKLSVEGKEIV